jgi:hypothetical protein
MYTLLFVSMVLCSTIHLQQSAQPPTLQKLDLVSIQNLVSIQIFQGERHLPRFPGTFLAGHHKSPGSDANRSKKTLCWGAVWLCVPGSK